MLPSISFIFITFCPCKKYQCKFNSMSFRTPNYWDPNVKSHLLGKYKEPLEILEFLLCTQYLMYTQISHCLFIYWIGVSQVHIWKKRWAWCILSLTWRASACLKKQRYKPKEKRKYFKNAKEKVSFSAWAALRYNRSL